MTARAEDAVSTQGQDNNPRDWSRALYEELTVFLPSQALQRINELLSTIPVDLRKLSTAVQDDPKLAAETVKLLNTPLFGLARPVSSLEQAVVGTDAEIVKTLLLTCWLTRVSGSNVANFENQLFWSHSLLVAQISRGLNEWAALAQPELAFLAGLLHDIGNLLFLALFSRKRSADLHNFPKDYECIELQRRCYGPDHCELGRRLGTILGLPFPLAEVISKHHQPGLSTSCFPLLPIIGAAEAIAQGPHLFAKQEMSTEAAETFIKTSIEKWLPGINVSPNDHMFATLESELFARANIIRPTPEIGNILSHPL